MIRILRCSRGWWYVHLTCGSCPGRASMGYDLASALVTWKVERRKLRAAEAAQ